MSSIKTAAATASKTGGTQSPPLEDTGSAEPMGISSVNNPSNAGYVKDSEQRKQYFQGGAEGDASKQDPVVNSENNSGRRAAGTEHEKTGRRMMGESMADKFEKAT